MSKVGRVKDASWRKRFMVILSRPEKAENIGLVARCMKNTGFENLRLVGLSSVDPRSYSIAVHSQEILDRAQFFVSLTQATSDLNLIFAATSKKRKNFALLSLEEAVTRMIRFSESARIGLLFGCERTGLTSEELECANFVFSIPQASRQPPYNLSSAVLITLFQIFLEEKSLEKKETGIVPLTRAEQEECIGLILKNLEKKGFIHKTNRLHITERLNDLFGRLTMTPKDRELLLALFSKGIDDVNKLRR